VTRTGGLRPVAAALLAGLVLAGCVAPSQDGPVVSGPEQGQSAIFAVTPRPPQLDAAPQVIVRDFVAAGRAVADNFKGARAYLVAAKAASWRADKEVVVFRFNKFESQLVSVDGVPVPPAPTTTGTSPAAKPSVAAKPSAAPSAAPSATVTLPSTPPSTAPATADRPAATVLPGRTAVVRVVVAVVAVVDSAGHYLPAAPGEQRTVTFGLSKVAGQWRISRLDDGLLIDEGNFRQLFQPRPLYFADPTGNFLVPDLRWYPVTTGINTTLVQGLLAGPAAWLAPAVVSGAPPETRLAAPAVVVTDGTAVVDLDERAFKATAAQRKLLQRQLEATLDDNVTITVKKAAYQVGTGQDPPGGDVSGPLKDPTVTEEPLVLDGTRGGLAQISEFGGVQVTQRAVTPVPKIVGLSRRAGGPVAMSAAGNAFAALDAGRTALWYQLQGSPKERRVLTGAHLTDPSFDPLGWVWCTEQQSTGTVTAVPPEGAAPAAGAVAGAPVAVKAAWLAGRRVDQLRVSRDGARVLLVVTGPGRRGAQVLVAGIRRGPDGVPLELVAQLRLAPELVSVTSAAWLDETRVVLLGSAATGGQRTWFSQVGGPTQTAIAVAERLPADTVSVTAGNSEQDLYLGTRSGRVYARFGSSWLQVMAAGRFPVFPG
jgi:hypothetical protein